jgi:hypothetical protein
MYRGGRFLRIVSSALLIRILWAGPCIGIMGAVLVVFILSQKYSTILPGWPTHMPSHFFLPFNLKNLYFFCYSNHLKVLITPRSQCMAASLGLVPWYNGGCVGCVYPFSQIFNHSPWLVPHTCRAFFLPFSF